MGTTGSVCRHSMAVQRQQAPYEDGCQPRGVLRHWSTGGHFSKDQVRPLPGQHGANAIVGENFQ